MNHLRFIFVLNSVFLINCIILEFFMILIECFKFHKVHQYNLIKFTRCLNLIFNFIQSLNAFLIYFLVFQNSFYQIL